ncbi:MAG: UTP--glucose-1-phosphate uridylyltransferase [Deltaproteobacteria bacterium]|nr:MAG: UTP--glucose-1-phosphate uridylyltransferase [Deltaproteobacteria bacterium]
MTFKAVIIAAGYGTRLLPATRVLPKELLPLVDRPAIDFVVEELVEAGVTDLLLITSRRKRALEDWFDHDPELEAALEQGDRHDLLERAQPRGLRVHIVRQARMGGTGDALLLASAFAGEDPVLVAYPDDLFVGSNPSLALVETWRKTGCTVLTAADLSGQDVSRYGVLDATREGEHLRVRGIVEKPAPGTEPSSLVTYGRYLYTPDFFPVLERLYQEHRGGEYYPMPAIEELASAGRVVATTVGGVRRDTGSTLGYVRAFLEEALARPDLRPALLQWMADASSKSVQSKME